MGALPDVTAILIASHEAPEPLLDVVASLRRQTLAPTQVICVDQSEDGRFAARLAQAEPHVEVVSTQGRNLGYPSACNLAAGGARGEALLFLNPDAQADPHCVEHLGRALSEHPRAAVAGAQVLLPDGRVNAGDNPLHLSGLSWAGRYGAPPEDGPPRPVAVCSGAALLVRRSAFEQLGGYTEGFFMYYDDVDLAWRARLRDWQVLFCPRAQVVHDYEFEKGTHKWLYLERNRWWCLLAHLQGRTLVALLPLLAAVEGATWLHAARQGWLAEKAAAWRLLWRDRSALRRRRRQVQASRCVGDREILSLMVAEVDSPFLGAAAPGRAAPLLRAYRRLLLALAA